MLWYVRRMSCTQLIRTCCTPATGICEATHPPCPHKVRILTLIYFLTLFIVIVHVVSYLDHYDCYDHTCLCEPCLGGFLVVRPSMARFDELRAIIKKGDHRAGSGWGGSGIGNFWGGQTIQGIVPYFYHVVHPGDSLELNRYVYIQIYS